jgi:hypothetical protein
VPWIRGKALIEQRRGALDEPVGVANNVALAARIVDILNALDPYHIAPARRVTALWF